MDPKKDEPGEGQTELGSHDRLQRAHRQGSDGHSLQVPRRQDSVEFEWGFLACPGRGQHAKPFLGQPMDHELQDPHRRAIKPLQVVDGQQDRDHGRERSDDSEHGRGDRTSVRPFPSCLGPDQSDLERSDLRAREVRDGLVQDRLHQVGQGHEREGRLGLDGAT